MRAREQGLSRRLRRHLRSRTSPLWRALQSPPRRDAPAALQRLAKTNVVIIDDLGGSPLEAEDRRDLREVLEDRYSSSSTASRSERSTTGTCPAPKPRGSSSEPTRPLTLPALARTRLFAGLTAASPRLACARGSPPAEGANPRRESGRNAPRGPDLRIGRGSRRHDRLVKLGTRRPGGLERCSSPT